MPIDRAGAERAVAQFLAALGHDTESDPELAGTPARVVEAFAHDLLSGYEVDIASLLAEGSAASSGDQGLLMLRDIAISTICPHHLLPALGQATVAYHPGKRLLGLGTLTALVDVYSRRLTLQESIAQDVVHALMDHAGARGAWCRIELVHSCLSARGPRQSSARVESVASAGSLADPGSVAELTRPGPVR